MSPIRAPGSTPFSPKPLNFRGATQQTQTAKNPLVTGGQTIVSFRGNEDTEQTEEPKKSTPFYKKAIFWIGAAIVGAAAWFFSGGKAIDTFKKAVTIDVKDLKTAIQRNAKTVLDKAGQDRAKLAEDIGEMTEHIKTTFGEATEKVKEGIGYLAETITGHEGFKKTLGDFSKRRIQEASDGSLGAYLNEKTKNEIIVYLQDLL